MVKIKYLDIDILVEKNMLNLKFLYFFIYSYYLEDIDVFLEFYNIDKKVCWSYVIVCI